MRGLIIGMLFVLCCSTAADCQRADFAAILDHFEGDSEKARDSLQRYRTYVREVAAQDRWEALTVNKRLDTLKTIDLSYLRIDTVPTLLRSAVGMEKLILNHNQIRKLPRWMKELPELKRIEWSNNELPKPQVKLTKLPHLRSLELENNELTKVSKLQKAGKLKRISLAGNNFKSVPIKALKKNDSLREVSLNKNPGLQLGPEKYSKLSMVKVLKVHECGLSEYDPSIYTMASLEDLQFANNQITAIQPGISQLAKLTKLSFYQNQLQELPLEIFDLRGLQIIDLYYNQLKVIPTEIQQWDSLMVLYLSNNLIYDLPEEVGKLTGLTQLYLHHNRLSALPASLSNLKKLHILRIDHNYLTEFPEQILDLSKLGYLDISENDLTTLPKNFAESFPDLYLFNFLENPIDFESPGQEFISQMVFDLLQKGVVCTPRVEREIVEEQGR